jgi:hypothetical protein
MVCTTTVIGSSKHQARPPTDHFEKLLAEIFPNHAYPVKHKHRNCGVTKNFTATGSLTPGLEVDEGPNKGDTSPFPREDIVMMIYDGGLSPGMRHMSNLSLGTPSRYGWGRGNTGM